MICAQIPLETVSPCVIKPTFMQHTVLGTLFWERNDKIIVQESESQQMTHLMAVSSFDDWCVT